MCIGVAHFCNNRFVSAFLIVCLIWLFKSIYQLVSPYVVFEKGCLNLLNDGFLLLQLVSYLNDDYICKIVTVIQIMKIYLYNFIFKLVLFQLLLLIYIVKFKS